MRRAFLPLFLLSVGAAGAAWDGDVATQLETGFASRAQVRGVAQAREGAFAAARVSTESLRAEARWHQAFRGRDERLGALGLGYDLWESSSGASVEVQATHRRFSAANVRGVDQTTEVGVRFTLAAVDAFVPTFSYHRDLRRDADLIEARVAREFALTRWGAFLNTSVFAGIVDAADVSPDRVGPPVRDAYAYFGADARLPYRVGERTMLVLAAHVSGGHGASGAWSSLARASRTSAGVDLSVTFDF